MVRTQQWTTFSKYVSATVSVLSSDLLTHRCPYIFVYIGIQFCTLHMCVRQSVVLYILVLYILYRGIWIRNSLLYCIRSPRQLFPDRESQRSNIKTSSWDCLEISFKNKIVKRIVNHNSYNLRNMHFTYSGISTLILEVFIS